jgi:hypothetical protein
MTTTGSSQDNSLELLRFLLPFGAQLSTIASTPHSAKLTANMSKRSINFQKPLRRTDDRKKMRAKNVSVGHAE